jgi:SAM-dependent methyltransferase
MPDYSADHWDAVYQSKAETAVSWFEQEPRISLRLIERTGAPKDAPILDVGGGLSRLPECLAAAGYRDITVLDISGEAIRRLLERQAGQVRQAGRTAEQGGIEGIVADITNWRPPRDYAVWHDRAVLHFLTGEDDRIAYRDALLAGLRPQGHAIIATFAPSGPERCSGLPVRRYDAQALGLLLGEGFALRDSFEFDHRTPAGAVQRFHVGWLQRLERR